MITFEAFGLICRLLTPFLLIVCWLQHRRTCANYRTTIDLLKLQVAYHRTAADAELELAIMLIGLYRGARNDLTELRRTFGRDFELPADATEHMFADGSWIRLTDDRLWTAGWSASRIAIRDVFWDDPVVPRHTFESSQQAVTFLALFSAGPLATKVEPCENPSDT